MNQRKTRIVLELPPEGAKKLAGLMDDPNPEAQKLRKELKIESVKLIEPKEKNDQRNHCRC